VIFSDVLTVTRTAAETINSLGRAVPGATSTFTAICSVQRPQGRLLEKLLEGFGTTDFWHVDTRTQLRTFDEQAGLPADTMVIDGLTYEVHQVEYHRAVIPHYECLVKRVNAGRSP
jgi:hypothetical protein